MNRLIGTCLLILVHLICDVSVAQVGPVISEFVASNKASLRDKDGDFPDWIEIHNPTDQVLSLDGWYLTDDVRDLEKW